MTQNAESIVKFFRRQSPVSVLGPYQRATIWVQGCHFACQGCVVPESWDMDGAQEASVKELADWILAQSDIEGITLSGGEPMLQASALEEMLTLVKQKQDLGVVCYTGYRWEQLHEQGTAPQKALLEHIDLLIDGTYVEKLHDDLLWRGSRNQRLLLLSDRYQEILAQHLELGDRAAGLEFGIDTTGEFYFTGVPNRKGFRQELEARLKARGILFNDQ